MNRTHRIIYNVLVDRYLERAIYDIGGLRGQQVIDHVNVLREPREDPAEGRHLEEL